MTISGSLPPVSRHALPQKLESKTMTAAAYIAQRQRVKDVKSAAFPPGQLFTAQAYINHLYGPVKTQKDLPAVSGLPHIAETATSTRVSVWTQRVSSATNSLQSIQQVHFLQEQDQLHAKTSKGKRLGLGKMIEQRDKIIEQQKQEIFNLKKLVEFQHQLISLQHTSIKESSQHLKDSQKAVSVRVLKPTSSTNIYK